MGGGLGPFGLSAFDWGLVALVVFPLLQLPLVVFLSRYVEIGEETTLDHAVEFRAPDTDSDPDFHDVPNGSERTPDRSREPRPRSRGDRTVESRSSAPSRIVCPACDVENDPVFTFCRSCVARLSSSRPVTDPTPPY